MPVSTLIHYFEVCTPAGRRASRVLHSRAIVFHSIIGLSARCLSPPPDGTKKKGESRQREGIFVPDRVDG